MGIKMLIHRQLQDSIKLKILDDAMAIIMSYTGEKPENEAVTQLT